MRKRGIAVREAVFDRAAQRPGDPRDPFRAQVPAHHVASERQGQAGLLFPPSPEVDEEDEAVVGIRQLSLVNQEASCDFAGGDLLLDAVERYLLHVDPRRPEREGERRRRAAAGRGDGDGARRDVLAGERLPRDDDRAVPVAEGRSVREEQVTVGEIGIGVEGHGGDVELARDRSAVQRLDVGELVREDEALRVDVALRETVKHESVVGVRAMREGDRCHARDSSRARGA